MKIFLTIFFVVSLTSLNAQQFEKYNKNEHYFDKDREYHYNAIYIDKNGDTITCEKMILKPLGRPWLPQMRVQQAIRYIYKTDTSGYRNYIDPIDFFHEKDMNYYKKKGKVRISKKETVGATQKYHDFYMHPPRTNQYRMLFYAAHPRVLFIHLNDTVNNITTIGNAYGVGKFNQKYTISPLPDTLVNNTKVQAWKVFVTSNGDLKEKFEEKKIYDSTLDAIFTREYGFIKMHYTFENNIKIDFDFEKMVKL